MSTELLGEPTIRRAVSVRLHEAMVTSPVVALTGPRTAGKSTLARKLVVDRGGSYLDLDDPAVRDLARSDPGAFVAGLPEPIVIDEFQRAPDILAAIKSELNRDRRAGRYVLTGSARHQIVPQLADFLTGRVELLTLWPFAMSELQPGAPTIVDRLFDGSLLAQRYIAPADRAGLVDLVLRGGYPIAVGLPDAARRRWFTNLAQLVIERLNEAATPEQARVAARFLRLLAARTGQVVSAAEVGREIELGRDTSADLVRLLELVYLVTLLPAWAVNLSARVTKRPKLHVVDSGLAAALQGAGPDRLSAVDPAGATRFGALLETFVVMEVVKQLGWSDEQAQPYHFRTSDGIEVDLLLEATDGRVVAVEVKAGARISHTDGRGLRHLRDRLGNRFVAGIILTSGENAQRIDDRIAVAPVQTLWSHGGTTEM